MLQFRSKLVQRKGQSLVEYAMLLGFVIAFVMGVRGFFTTRLSGMVTDKVNDLTSIQDANGAAFTSESYAPTTTSSSSSDFESSAFGSGAENSAMNATSTSNTVTNY
jgi:hypothetical protein